MACNSCGEQSFYPLSPAENEAVDEMCLDFCERMHKLLIKEKIFSLPVNMRGRSVIYTDRFAKDLIENRLSQKFAGLIAARIFAATRKSFTKKEYKGDKLSESITLTPDQEKSVKKMLKDVQIRVKAALMIPGASKEIEDFLEKIESVGLDHSYIGIIAAKVWGCLGIRLVEQTYKNPTPLPRDNCPFDGFFRLMGAEPSKKAQIESGPTPQDDNSLEEDPFDEDCLEEDS